MEVELNKWENKSQKLLGEVWEAFQLEASARDQEQRGLLKSFKRFLKRIHSQGCLSGARPKSSTSRRRSSTMATDLDQEREARIRQQVPSW